MDSRADRFEFVDRGEDADATGNGWNVITHDLINEPVPVPVMSSGYIKWGEVTGEATDMAEPEPDPEPLLLVIATQDFF